MRFSVGNRCLMDPNLIWDLILDLIALRGTKLDHLECSKIAVGDVAGVTAWVYIVHCDDTKRDPTSHIWTVGNG